MIGSHNTMSYMPPRQWWAKILKFTAKCQSKSLHDQLYKYGCRVFDFRVRYTKTGDLVFAHGPIEFHGHVKTYIKELDAYAKDFNEPIYARIILESNSPMKDQELQEEHFIYFCEDIQKECKNLIFFGGRRKYDWAKLYEFYTVEPELDDKYSSTTNPFGERTNTFWDKIDDLWPWLYARTHNKKNIKNHTGDKCLFLDFVNIR